jgi:hypothetical protein
VASPAAPRLPNFLILGAARSGTSTLYSLLQEHPQVYLPLHKRPEPHFFLKEEEYAKGLAYYAARWFAGAHDELAVGEASTSYLCHERVARRVREHLPDARLVVLLRDPVERAYSGYWHTRDAGLEDLTFEEAVAREPERLAAYADPFWRAVRPHAYLERGFYARQLGSWLRYFPRPQLGIWLFEDLVTEPARTWREVLRFLGVDDRVALPASDRALNPATPADAPLAPELRAQLVETFRDDILALQKLLGRCLSGWLEGSR